MEGRYEQLIVVVVVIALSLFDLLMRWAKRRARDDREGQPEREDRELAYEDEPVEEPGAAETVGSGEADEELERVEADVFGRRGPWDAGAPPLPPLAPATVERVPARAPERGSVPRPDVPGRPSRRGRRVLCPGDARRGIVLMTMLGPCRAQEMEQRQRPNRW